MPGLSDEVKATDWFPPPLRLEVQLESIEEMRALLKARRFGWSALTAREAMLCQQVVLRLAGAIVIKVS